MRASACEHTLHMSCPLPMHNFHDLPVHRYTREISSTYGGVRIGVPVSAKPLSLSYRRDVFAAADLSAPNTW
jgi:hypothetical protein